MEGENISTILITIPSKNMKFKNMCMSDSRQSKGDKWNYLGRGKPG